MARRVVAAGAPSKKRAGPAAEGMRGVEARHVGTSDGAGRLAIRLWAGFLTPGGSGRMSTAGNDSSSQGNTNPKMFRSQGLSPFPV